jgi:hypothetical protein
MACETPAQIFGFRLSEDIAPKQFKKLKLKQPRRSKLKPSAQVLKAKVDKSFGRSHMLMFPAEQHSEESRNG